MKHVLYSLTALTLLSSVLTYADEVKPVVVAHKKDFNNVKIAYIDPYGVLEKSKEWEAQAEIIKNDFEARVKTIQGMEAKKQKLEAELTSMGNAATATAKENKQKEILSLMNNIKIEQQAAQEIPQQRAQNAQMDILKKIEDATKKIKKENGIDLVFAGSIIGDAPERIDITQLVSDELNKSFKPAAKPAAPAKPANATK